MERSKKKYLELYSWSSGVEMLLPLTFIYCSLSLTLLYFDVRVAKGAQKNECDSVRVWTNYKTFCVHKTKWNKTDIEAKKDFISDGEGDDDDDGKQGKRAAKMYS